MSAILLIRHGQASFGAADYDALSPLGERQARILGTELGRRGLVPARVVCGAMRRHRQTAAACLGALGATCEWDTDAGWNEYDHNDVLAALDARYRKQSELAADLAARPDSRAAFQQVFGTAVARWLSGRHDADYRESWQAFHTRVAAALKRVRDGVEHHQIVLVFTSGGAIASACRSVLGLNDAQTLALNWAQANASLTKLLVGRDGLRLSSFNSHGHLEAEGAASGERLISYR